VAGDGVIACTVDEDPVFHLEAVRWFATLTRIAGVSPSDLCVSVVGGATSELLSYLEDCGVTLLPVEPFDGRCSYCSKIAGAQAIAVSKREGVAVLTDVDTAFVADPRQIDLPSGAIGGRPVDGPNPSLSRIRAVYEQADLELPQLCSASRVPEPTITPNLNGGFLLLHMEDLGRVVDSWGRWALWLLDSGAMGDPPRFFVQVAAALVVTDLGLQAVDVGPQWNLATHVPAWNTQDLPTPAMVHYHRHVLPDGLIAPIGVPNVDRVIDQMNAAVSDEFAQLFPAGTLEGVSRYLPRTRPEREGYLRSVLGRTLPVAVRRRLGSMVGSG